MKYSDILDKSATFKLRFRSRGVPAWKQLWKWLTVQRRANKLQLRQLLRQEAQTAAIPVSDFVKQHGLPSAFQHKFILDPTTDKNWHLMRYDAVSGNITNKPMGFGLYNTNTSVKPTDALLHEIGHAQTVPKDIDVTAFFKQRYMPSLRTAITRLLHPDTADLVKWENKADVAAFGRNGVLRDYVQLRHHPAIAGYRATARLMAGAQLGTAATALGGAGYAGYKFLKDQQPEERRGH